MRYFEKPLAAEETEDAIDRYNAQLDRDGFTMFAAEDRESKTLVGVLGMQTMRFAVPHLPQPAVEIGWRLALSAQGRGLATEGARAVIDHAFKTLGLQQLVAITIPANTPSRRVMEKLGMAHRPELSFDHPSIPAGHPYQQHVLYSLTNAVAEANS
jgi:RimJ/RimL family protein N-acetyltransferase